MKNGKYYRPQKGYFHVRYVAVLVSMVLLLTGTLGGTLAYLLTSDAPVENEFLPSQVTSLVVEDNFNGQTKSNVKIQNTGDISAFIRADIVVTWMHEAKDGTITVLHEKPVLNTDYTMSLNTGKWVEKDGYYYWPAEVAAAGMTENLINSATMKNTRTVDGKEYTISIEIVSSAIQAQGTDSKGNKPVELAWGVNIADGNVSAASITQ